LSDIRFPLRRKKLGGGKEMVTNEFRTGRHGKWLRSLYIDFFYFFNFGDSKLADVNDMYLFNAYSLLGKFCRMINDPYWRGVAVDKLFTHDGGLTDICCSN
jgi:hypothetical protein